jgi:hypothetical protein
MAKSLSDLESLIEDGENPNGFTSQTCNGTSHATGTGWNRDKPNWDMASVPDTIEDYERRPDHQIRPEPTWPAGRSNRTGE